MVALNTALLSRGRGAKLSSCPTDILNTSNFLHLSRRNGRQFSTMSGRDVPDVAVSGLYTCYLHTERTRLSGDLSVQVYEQLVPREQHVGRAHGDLAELRTHDIDEFADYSYVFPRRAAPKIGRAHV